MNFVSNFCFNLCFVKKQLTMNRMGTKLTTRKQYPRESAVASDSRKREVSFVDLYLPEFRNISYVVT